MGREAETETVEVARVVKLTSRAALLEIGSEKKWVPLSVIDVDGLARLDEGAEDVEIEVQRWFVEKEGLS